jgi:hypothetical protein
VENCQVVKMAFGYGLVVKKCLIKYGYNFIQSHNIKQSLIVSAFSSFFFQRKIV